MATRKSPKPPPASGYSVLDHANIVVALDEDLLECMQIMRDLSHGPAKVIRNADGEVLAIRSGSYVPRRKDKFDR